jgi:hypothetical protein
MTPLVRLEKKSAIRARGQYILPRDYCEKEWQFILRCLGGRLSHQSEKKAAESEAAVIVFLEKGVTALPSFLRLGGWEYVTGSFLNVKGKERDLLACRIASAFEGLRHQAQGPKDSGRDSALQILHAVGKTLIPVEAKHDDLPADRFNAARADFLRDREDYLPRLMNRGGWEYIFSFLLTMESTHYPLAVQIANALVSLRQKALEPGTEGRKVREILREAGKTLAPDLRGKRQSLRVEDEDMVRWQFYRELFLWRQIHNYLGNYRTIRRTHVERASRMYGVSVESIRRHWGFNEDFEPHAHPLPLHDIALMETAFRFAITVPTVSNLLASY